MIVDTRPSRISEYAVRYESSRSAATVRTPPPLSTLIEHGSSKSPLLIFAVALSMFTGRLVLTINTGFIY